MRNFTFRLFAVATLLTSAMAMSAGKVEKVIGDLKYEIDTDAKEATVIRGDYEKLTEVVIPEAVDYNGTSYPVTTIGMGALYYLPFTSVTIPNSVKTIGEKAFYLCYKLTSVTIPNSVVTIEAEAFEQAALTSITLSNSVETIGARAFADNKLVSVEIPGSVTSIGASAFNCLTLESITVASDNPSYSTVDGVLYSKDLSTLLTFPCGRAETEFVIPQTVKTIGTQAFSNCMNITSITIPNSVTTIAGFAFWGSGITSLTIPNSVTKLEDGAIYGCSHIESITIPSSVTALPQNVFGGCSSLTSITIPNSVTSIGSNAFYQCIALADISIPNSVTTIESYTFSGCTSLSSMNIPNSVTKIGRNAFQYCIALKEISIPNSVNEIDGGIFYGCTSLNSVKLPNTLKNVSQEAFYGCSSLASISLPSSVRSVGRNAFEGCYALKTVTCLAENAPVAESSSFSVYDDATLYVPKESVEQYKSWNPWSNFGNIVGIDVTGVDGVVTEIGNDINAIYRVDGKKENDMKRGLNVVRMSNGRTKKVLVK